MYSQLNALQLLGLLDGVLLHSVEALLLLTATLGNVTG
jgi:hypothetical protein